MKKAKSENPPDENNATFEESLEALEQVVAKLEGGELPLEESMKLFEQGMQLAKRCEELLNQVEGKIQELVEGKNGELVVEECEWAKDE